MLYNTLSFWIIKYIFVKFYLIIFNLRNKMKKTELYHHAKLL